MTDKGFASLAASLPGGPVHRFFVPGRIEVLGKHTDYAGGRSFTCAIDRGFAVAAVARRDATVRMTDAGTCERAEFAISAELSPTVGTWSNYPMTVAKRLALNFSIDWRGADIAFESDLPHAAGLSSSSAFMTATFLVLSAVNDLPNHPRYRECLPNGETLAEYLGAIENGSGCRGLAGTTGVGTFGGSEDHTAILLAEPGRLGCYSYSLTRRVGSYEWPADLAFVVASSGVKAEKTGDTLPRYNRLTGLAREITEKWNRVTGRADAHLAAILDSPGFELDSLIAMLDPEQRQRLQHFHLEDRRFLPRALDAISKQNLPSFLNVLNASHDAGAIFLENQIPETLELVRLAREQRALAASAFGAGFGGSVYAVVNRSDTKEFCNSWRDEYRQRFPQHAAQAAFFVTRPSAAARRVE